MEKFFRYNENIKIKKGEINEIMKNKNKHIKLIPLFLIAILLLSGCGNSNTYSSETGMKDYASSDEMSFDFIAGNNSSSNNSDYNYAEDAIIEEAPSMNTNTNKNEENSSILEGAKLIRDVYINMETTSLDSVIEEMEKRTTELGGYIQDVNMYNYSYSRNYTMTIRIPYEKVDTFLSGIEEFGTINNMNDSTRDITLTYAGTETRLANLNKQHTRLLELLEKSENLTDIIELEARLSEVETEIDSYSLELKNYDNLVNYSTISLSIEEKDYVSTNVDDSLWGRITSGLSDNLYNIKEEFFDFIVWFVIHIPNIVIWIIVICTIVFVFKKIKKKAIKPFKIFKKKNDKEDNN